MKQSVLALLAFFVSHFALAQPSCALDFAEDLFFNYRMNYDYAEYQDSLANIPYDKLKTDLDTDAKKLVFWLNVYNVYAQIHLENNPDDYKNRLKFFSEKFIVVAGKKFSLNKIEHGILRKSKALAFRGALPKLFPSKTERELRVQKPDYRLHFALNCGAKSCPPIAYYELLHIDDQLDMAAQGFLHETTKVDTALNEVKTSRIMGWYRADFGGKKGILKWLKHYEVIPQDMKPRVKFAKYDWSATPKDYEE